MNICTLLVFDIPCTVILPYLNDSVGTINALLTAHLDILVLQLNDPGKLNVKLRNSELRLELL